MFLSWYWWFTKIIPGASPSDYYETVAKIECTTNGVSVTETVSADGDKISEEKLQQNMEHSDNSKGSDDVKKDEKGAASTSAASNVADITNSPMNATKLSNRTIEEMEEAALVSF